MMKLTLVFVLSMRLLQTPTAQQAADPCESLKRERQAMESQLRDWPNLAKYREANARLGLPVEGESRVVFLGDSITEAWDLSVFFKGKPFVNRGISGQTTPQILLRFRQDVIALKPDIVVILAGTNDIAENTGPTSLGMIEDNLKSMAELARGNGVHPILASVLPAAVYPWRPEIRPIEKILGLNQWMKEYAAREGIGFLDYYSSMVNDRYGLKPEFSGDGVHPNEAGYTIMASIVADAIAKLKLQPSKKSP
ncbi:MAG TPA: SGNH/GDSL hydrolase family protein [Candidatus Acidoferrum sp.]|jgi:lysophospholipase L1-like esterase|nr:SGNH/GDSL hydrolase family protein [Candidatus Acidoferrum sp.]